MWAYRKNNVGQNNGIFVLINWTFPGPDMWEGDDNKDGDEDNGTNADAKPSFPTGTFKMEYPSQKEIIFNVTNDVQVYNNVTLYNVKLTIYRFVIYLPNKCLYFICTFITRLT